MDLDPQLVGAGNHLRQQFFRGRRHQRDRMVARVRLQNAAERFQPLSKMLGVLIFAEVQNQGIHLPHLGGQLALGAQGNQLAVVDDPDPVRELLRFFHVVRGVKNGHAGVVQGLDRIEDCPAGLRVNADGRFVHKQQARFVQQPHGDVHAALHPAAVGLDALFGAVCQPDLLQQLLHAGFQRTAGKAVHLAPEIQVLERGHVVVKRNLLRNHPNQALNLHRIFSYRKSEDGRVAFGGHEQRGKDGDCGCFSGAVRTQQAEYFPFLNVKGNIVHG